MKLFDFQEEEQLKKDAPLAVRMRPRNISEFFGQEHLIGTGKPLRKAIESDHLPSIIFWGPPGSGKTTLASIISKVTKSHFSPVSAVSAGVNDLRLIIEEAKERRGMYQQKTILFIDEIHRFNKTQQDAILPYVENGTITLIGATTENPSFEVTSPLLSRCHVFTLNPLTSEQVKSILNQALSDNERGLGKKGIFLEEAALDSIVVMSGGDARNALNILEMVADTNTTNVKGKTAISLEQVKETVQHRTLFYDKTGEQHYNIISALHKSMRGSDPDASLYWLGRMLEAGEDPLYIARRLVRFASEDIGLADPQALVITISAQQAVHFIGMPEGNLALAETVIYLATAPKSNSVYRAYSRAKEDVINTRAEPVPLHLRNAVTSLMKDIGYGKGYKYAHDYEDSYVKQQNLPDIIKDKKYYYPGTQGYEKEIKERLNTWANSKEQNRKNPSP
jgi:putative ATPase